MRVRNKNKKTFLYIGIVAILVLDEYSQGIESKKQKIGDIDDRINAYNKQIRQKETEGVSLRNQVAILESEILKIELDIERTGLEIEKLDLEIKSLNFQIKQAENDIADVFQNFSIRSNIYNKFKMICKKP